MPCCRSSLPEAWRSQRRVTFVTQPLLSLRRWGLWPEHPPHWSSGRDDGRGVPARTWLQPVGVPFADANPGDCGGSDADGRRHAAVGKRPARAATTACNRPRILYFEQYRNFIRKPHCSVLRPNGASSGTATGPHVRSDDSGTYRIAALTNALLNDARSQARTTCEAEGLLSAAPRGLVGMAQSLASQTGTTSPATRHSVPDDSR